MGLTILNILDSSMIYNHTEEGTSLFYTSFYNTLKMHDFHRWNSYLVAQNVQLQKPKISSFFHNALGVEKSQNAGTFDGMPVIIN